MWVFTILQEQKSRRAEEQKSTTKRIHQLQMRSESVMTKKSGACADKPKRTPFNPIQGPMRGGDFQKANEQRVRMSRIMSVPQSHSRSLDKQPAHTTAHDPAPFSVYWITLTKRWRQRNEAATARSEVVWKVKCFFLGFLSLCASSDAVLTKCNQIQKRCRIDVVYLYLDLFVILLIECAWAVSLNHINKLT